jgi:hypothetical protein
MAKCAAVNGAGHQCGWDAGHSKFGFVGITSAPGVSVAATPAGKRPTIAVHGYWNPTGFWEIWPVAAAAPATGSPP